MGRCLRCSCMTALYSYFMQSCFFLPQTWGDLAAWSKEQLMDAGTILAGLLPTELNQLENVDLDVLESLGDYDTFSQEQVNSTDTFCLY